MISRYIIEIPGTVAEYVVNGAGGLVQCATVRCALAWYDLFLGPNTWVTLSAYFSRGSSPEYSCMLGSIHKYNARPRAIRTDLLKGRSALPRPEAYLDLHASKLCWPPLLDDDVSLSSPLRSPWFNQKLPVETSFGLGP